MLFRSEDAKNRFVYTFAITATHLLRVDENKAVITGEGAYDAATPVFSALGGDWYDAATDGIAAGSATLNASTGISASVSFDGKGVIAKNTATPVLTFTVTWGQNRMAIAGDYMADVTMTYTVE